MSPLLRTLTIICAVGAATAAGTFFTFSNFTMNGLKRLPPSQGARAMQAINREAPSPLFMILLFGTGAALAVLGVRAALNLDDPAAKYHLAAAGIYIVGVVILTIGYHVPRNDLLDAVAPADTEGLAYWGTYLREWVAMNHVRTVAPLVSAILLSVSLQLD